MNLSSVGKGDGDALIRADAGANVTSRQRPTLALFAWNFFHQNCLRKIGAIVALSMGLLHGAGAASASESGVTESQIKAAFLFNFAKYVEWPPWSFSETNSPIVMGVFNDSEVAVDLQKLAEAKKVGGRPVHVRRVDRPEEGARCHILFLGTEEQRPVSEFLHRVRDLSVLTVGESDDFLDRGGIINLAERDRKIRLDVNLNAARLAKLRISSKLLNVAERVK